MKQKTLLVTSFAIAAGVTFFVVRSFLTPKQVNEPTEQPTQVASDGATGEVSVEDVIERAIAGLKRMETTLDQYTARFERQELDSRGVLGELNVYRMKVQTRFQGEDNESPRRVYLDYLAPESLKGRELIWAEDLHDGKLVVHESGWKKAVVGTLRLDPTGKVAMYGERFPIYELGLVRLTERLIEDGKKDIDNPDATVTVTKNYSFDGMSCDLIQLRHTRPAPDTEGDFSLAEIIIDPNREIAVSFRSFGWPESDNDEPPLLESYSYYELDTEVTLTDLDFDPANPAYRY